MDRRTSLQIMLRAILATVFITLGGCWRSKEGGKKDRAVAIGRGEDFKFGVTVLELERLAVFRDERGFAAVSMVCTHMICALRFQADKFVCPCHGSNFSINGDVLNGPAKEALSFFRMSKNAAGQLVVHFDETVPPSNRFALLASS